MHLPSDTKNLIQVVQQSSELARVTYNIDPKNNKNAVYVPGLGIVDDFMASDDLNECVDALL